MTGLLYRLLYREEIRERRERLSAAAEVWRERQIENDRHWEQMTEWMHNTRARLATMSPDEVLAFFADPYADAPPPPVHWRIRA